MSPMYIYLGTYIILFYPQCFHQAVIAQLGERQTEDLKVPGSIPGRGIFLFSNFLFEFLFAITIHVFK